MPSHETQSAHSFCAALDELKDQAPANSSLLMAKYVLPAASFEAPPPLVFPPPPIRLRQANALRDTRVALNVRNCVFLI